MPLSSGAKAAVAGAAALVALLYFRRKAQSSRTIIPNPREFKEKCDKIIKGGLKSLQVVADFDRTLTKAFVRGSNGMSCHGMVESCPELSAEYRAETKRLFEYYFPIERSSTMSREAKIPLMKEWYHANHSLLIAEKMKHRSLRCAVESANTQLRPGAKHLIKCLGQHGVPFLIFSAGIADVLETFLSNAYGYLPETTHVISNRMVFDESGTLVGFKEPLIHMFNKDVEHLVGTPFADEVEARPNVILLGDSLGDVTMASDEHHNVVLRVGFLNSHVKELMDQYQANYDVVILGDGPMHLVNDLLHKIVANDGGVCL